ncbi:MAG TPA: hypothetical protein PLM79_01905 [Syntrophobacteraceae bacterium]|nr:hypothetical protein [Syntrophobacteraceae bacterium]
MDEDQALRWRSSIGKLGALVCAVFLVAVLDGLVARFREPAYEYPILAGQTLPVNGPLKETPPDAAALAFESSAEGVRLEFEAIQAGFWFGNALWRGTLTVDSGVPPGSYRVKVVAKAIPGTVLSPVIQVVVYADPHDFRFHSKSLFVRYLDISPWWTAILSLPLVCGSLCAILLLSRRIDGLLAREGKAEIYRVLGAPPEFEVAFGLGTVHGITEGAELALLDRQGIHVGTVKVREASPVDAVGVAHSMVEVKPGFLVCASSGIRKGSVHDSGLQGLIR